MLEDQHKINQFARLHRKLEELEEDAKAKKNEMQTLDDASAEILMLADDDEQVLKINYQSLPNFNIMFF